MLQIIVLSLFCLIILVAFLLLWQSSNRRSRNISRAESGTPATKRPPVKVNLIIGETPPPGSTVFNPDGTITKTPDSEEARNRWIVQKMTFKIQQEPNDGEWYAERGRALMALGRYEDAISDFNKLIELFPQWGNYYIWRGYCFLFIGDKEKALADLRQYRKSEYSRNPDDREIEMLERLEEANAGEQGAA